MKKLILFLLLLLLIGAAIAGWIFLGPGTGFSEKKKALYIRTNAANKKAVMDSLVRNGIIRNETAFAFLADRMDYWKYIKPGKYEIEKGSSLLEIVRQLRNGRQTPVDLVIIKLRTKEDLAALVGRKFETDSATMMAFLNSSDALSAFQTDTARAFVHVLPDKYSYFWNSTPRVIYEKLYKESKKFWTQERESKAAALGLTPEEVYILASIIEEETTNHQEKDTIASVYLNRLRINMPLQADPTLKFATRQFGLKHIAGKILDVVSPYNTYDSLGLPPGPICTPTRLTIDKVLNPASTSYLYFVARPRLGGHLFSSSFAEHRAKANAYRASDRIRRQKADSANKAKK